MSKTLGLALSAGGARGVAHVGFLKALEEDGVKPDYISGCSMGAVVGGLYASGFSPARMEDIVRSLRRRDIVDFSPALISKMALLRTKKVQNLFLQYLGEKKLEDFEIPFNCVSVDVLSGNLHTFKSGSAALAVQASSAIPGVFRPVRTDGMMLIDGGVLCRVPVRTLKDMGADVVVAVDVLKNCGQPIDEIHNIVSMLLRVYDIMDASQTGLRRELEGDLCDLLLEPDLGDISQYDIKAAEGTLSVGYRLGKANSAKIKELLR